MHIYDTLIVGSGYFSAGYALTRGNTVICEEEQICDTHFYLPQRSFRFTPYEPKTEYGQRLLDIFTELSLFDGGMQNVSGFESALATFFYREGVNILLKCRVIGIIERDGVYDATVQTNAGLSHLYAHRILDTRGTPTERSFTLLFVSEEIESVLPSLAAAFPHATVEPAFYRERYALHIPVTDTDENAIKPLVYQKWKEYAIPAKILYMAPRFSQRCRENEPCDDAYENAIAALEAGCFYAKEERR